MSITGKITNLFADKAMTIPAFPRTKIKAVSDDNGVGLDAILNGMVHAEEYSTDVAVAPLNADTLGGKTEDALSVARAVEAGNSDTFDGYTVNALKTLFVNSVYPVGSIYTSVDSTSPATLFGGTWEQIKDSFLLAAGSTYAAGTTGGEATHTLTVNEMPSHTHTAMRRSESTDDYVKSGSNKYGITAGSVSSGGAYSTSAAGGGAAHNNMPPYTTVYMWKRTA